MLRISSSAPPRPDFGRRRPFASCSQERRKTDRAKRLAKEDEWRTKFNKEERKKKLVERGQAEKRKALGGGKGGKGKKARSDKAEGRVGPGTG